MCLYCVDQEDNFIEDFDLDALSGHLSWEDDSVSNAPRTSEPEKTSTAAPPPVTPAPPHSPSPTTTQQEPQMDLEADFPVGESFQSERFS